MITPRFSLSQDASFIYIRIELKYAKVSNADFEVEDNEFTFYLDPYFLKLTFQQPLSEEGDQNRAAFDTEKSELVCTVAKLNPGQHFEDLDAIAKLITPSSLDQDEELKTEGEPLIKGLKPSGTTKNPQSEQMTEDQDQQKVQQKVSDEFKYGYINQYTDVFQGHEDLLEEVADFNPIEFANGDRLKKKFIIENEKFDPERYAFDSFDEEAMEPVKQIINNTKSLESQFESISLESGGLTAQEKQALVSLPKSEVQATPLQKESLLAQLTDILYAQHYDLRSNFFEHTSESGWTIIRLSSALSAFIDYSNTSSLDLKLKSVVINSLRRALIFPLYRNFDLAVKVWKDVAYSLGSDNAKLKVLKALLSIKQIFEEKHDLYNKCFIDDLCLWVNQVEEEELHGVGQKLQEIVQKIKKGDLLLDLEEIDEQAREYKESLAQ